PSSGPFFPLRVHIKGGKTPAGSGWMRRGGEGNGCIRAIFALVSADRGRQVFFLPAGFDGRRDMGLLAQITDLTLVDVTNIATILGSVSLVASVWLLFRELRENNKLTRASNTQTLVEMSSPFYLGLIQDRQMAEIYLRGARALEEMDEVDRYRYKSLIV